MNNKIILNCLFEIVVCISLIFISIVFWKKIDLSYYAEVAKNYENYPIISLNE